MPKAKKDTKPEIAREKLKEKRERLKKEKENQIIEEAKKRLAEETQKEAAQKAQAQKAEEEKKKVDPNYQLLQQMKEMMERFSQPAAPIPVPVAEPPKKTRGRKKKEEVAEVAEEEVVIPKKVVAPKAPKVKPPPKQRRKVVYLDKPVVSETTQFVGNDIYPEEEPAPRPPQSNLINYLLSRRNLNTFVQ